MAFRDKDYYAILGVPPTASHQAIKSAFRKKALATHPDTNPDNPANSLFFSQLKEAYDVLSNPQKRQDYHYARFFQPITVKEEPTVAEILQQAEQIATLIDAIDPYRVDYDQLMQKLSIVLNELNINVMQQKASEIELNTFVNRLLSCVHHLPYTLAVPFLDQLQQMLRVHPAISLLITKAKKQKKRHSLWEKYQTLAAFLIAIIICIIMYINR